MEYIFGLVGLILGLWIGAGVVYAVIKKSSIEHKNKDKEIAELKYTKGKLIEDIQELEHEIKLRDERNIK